MLHENNEKESSVDNNKGNASFDSIAVRITTVSKTIYDVVVDMNELVQIFNGEFPLNRVHLKCTKLDYIVGAKKKFLFFPEKIITYDISEEEHHKKDKFVKQKLVTCYVTDIGINIQSYHIETIAQIPFNINDTKEIAISNAIHMLQKNNKEINIK